MFTDHIACFFENHSVLQSSDVIAVAVSGGPDSMALASLLIEYIVTHDKKLHVLTVDHALRPDSKSEALAVRDWVQTFQNENIKHTTLAWNHNDPDSALMEQARQARYALMAAYCKEQNIQHLFIAHHADDQAETFLFRLSKGSGLDGLAAMAVSQDYNDITLWRPLLDVPKEDLIHYCKVNELPYVNDPSNEKQEYARPRLRAAREVLEKEGLTTERLSLTAKRLRRARSALEKISRQVYDTALKKKEVNVIHLNWTYLQDQPEEIALRVVSIALHHMQNKKKYYGVRMEKIEELFFALWHQKDLSLFKRRTLGGCMFSFEGDMLVLKKEK